MQQFPEKQTTDLVRTRRTQPALPGVTLPTTRTLAAPAGATRQVGSGQRGHGLHRTKLAPLWPLLLASGGFIEICYLGFLPLLVATHSSNDGSGINNTLVTHVLAHVWSWSKQLRQLLPPALLNSLKVVTLNANVNSATMRGAANAVFLLLLCSLALTLLASFVIGRRSGRRAHTILMRRLFWMMFFPTVLFGVTMLAVPVEFSMLSRDMLLYGLYGRVVVVYHLNPYVASPSLLTADPLQMLVKAEGVTPYGPVWTDVSLFVTLFARGGPGNITLGFRLLGLAAHLANSVLLWHLLTRLRPERRLALTLLYAWNPMVLLLGVTYMHVEIVVLFFFLLAALFFQRGWPRLGWLFIIVTLLVSPLWLLLIPLFWRFVARETRTWSGGGLLRSLGNICIALLVIVLAYLPYGRDGSLAGILESLRRNVPNTALNSLDSVLLSLPVHLPAPLQWLIIPRHWSLIALAVLGIGAITCAWIADTLELVLLFSCWLAIGWAAFTPTYWPWCILVPLGFAVASLNTRTVVVALLLAAGALVSVYCWWLPTAWTGQALLAISWPLVLWGWTLFFHSLWHMTRDPGAEVQEVRDRRPGFSRPPWRSRPSRPPSSRDL